ncbi:MAG: siderophore-interacting protein [Actinomycetota bacterium]
MIETIEEFLPDVVSRFGDTIRLAARPQLGPTDGEVQITEITPEGVRISAGDDSVWVDFLAPIDGIEELASATIALAEAARDLHPDEPVTSLETLMARASEQRVHRGEVISVERLSPHLAALRAGPFSDFVSLGWDQSLSLLTLADGRTVPDDLTLETWRDMPEDESPRGRTYTVRSVDDDGVMEIWLVLHGDEPDSTSTWVQQASPGDPIAIFGPRGNFNEPVGVERAVLIADESAFGAAAAVADQLDPSIDVTVLGVVAGPQHQFDGGFGERVDVRWFHAPVEASARAAAVGAHVASMDDTDTYFWGAGEYEMIKATRRALRSERRVPGERVALTGYWRAAGR